MRHRQTHPEYVEGCKPCRWATISFGTVPGGARDARNGVSNAKQRERDLHRYREKRRAGEQPDGTTKQAMDKYDRRVGSWEKTEAGFRDNTDPASFRKLERSTFNKK